MKLISYTFILFIMLSGLMIQAQPVREDLTVEYGPPAEANVWERFAIPLTADTFNVEPAVFEAALANITSFWIRTEMHTGNDVGGIDNVMVGPDRMSNFDFSSEGWSSGGDGTMAWMQSGGVEGGFLQISDWATGDWHWLIAPASWAGDWSALNGDSIIFWYKTDRPSYAAVIKLTTDPVSRLVINTPAGNFIPPNDSIMVEIEILPEAGDEITISFSSSSPGCIMVPASVTVPAESSSVNVYFKAPEDATVGCSSVIEATAPGYLLSRATMIAEDHSSVSILEPTSKVVIFPNPSNGKFRIEGSQGMKIDHLIIYDLLGNMVTNASAKSIENQEFDASNLTPGVYFVKLFSESSIVTEKIVLE